MVKCIEISSNSLVLLYYSSGFIKMFLDNPYDTG